MTALLFTASIDPPTSNVADATLLMLVDGGVTADTVAGSASMVDKNSVFQ
ncbi:MAG: hypothetical protein RQ936_03550 [Gammaproteobacteria bacterium]|nr:hypothetical protein [Gammaproteobacteria bacterium]